MRDKKGFDKTFEDFFDESIHEGRSIEQSIGDARYGLRIQADRFNNSIRLDFLKDDSVCEICNTNKRLQLDHIIPICKGGKNEIENIRVLCYKCNGKQNKGLRNSTSPFKRPYRQKHLDTMKHKIEHLGDNKISITTTIEFSKV